ncbi:2-hydroxyacid dehydrogenase [Methylobacterium sp. E-065]|nr:2-hydroxyacid dehydrogenase [Methylobacterium sp. E-065]MCJ2016458.1 2-hydroxyacid dehydrogenase [Methylobacterium sp. E-065]
MPVRIPNNTDFSVLSDEEAAAVRAIAAGGGHDSIDKQFFDWLPNLEIVASFGVGYDHIDAAEAAQRGIVVTHTPDVLTEDVADIALALLLGTVRRTGQAERFLRAGHWRTGTFPLTLSLRERSVGILGLGRIGKAIARRIEAFGVPVNYCGRRRQAEVTYPYYEDLVALAGAVDTLIIAAPGGPSTDGLVDRAVLEALGPNGIVVNVGRGSIINEAHLAEALRDGTIVGAGLDVFEHEPQVPEGLLACENAVLLPHIGSASHYTRNAMARLVVDNLVAWFAGQDPLTPVAETPFRRSAA